MQVKIRRTAQPFGPVPKGCHFLTIARRRTGAKKSNEREEGSFPLLMAHWGDLSHFLSLPSHHPVENLIAGESLGPKVG
jgi:hypothetical protein